MPAGDKSLPIQEEGEAPNMMGLGFAKSLPSRSGGENFKGCKLQLIKFLSKRFWQPGKAYQRLVPAA